MTKILLVEDDEQFLLATAKLMSRDFDEFYVSAPQPLRGCSAIMGGTSGS